MNLVYHPAARRDIRLILDYYDKESSRSADRFFAEVLNAEKEPEQRPTHFHFVAPGKIRFNLVHFPFHIIYEIVREEVRVLVVKHHRRHPNYGLGRRWPRN